MEPDFQNDPMFMAHVLWPDVQFYDKQIEVIESIRDNDETVVPAGNELGKDFVAGFIALWFFLTRDPCRIVTTSAKDDHLRVLWGEIGRFIQTSRIPLRVENGGPLIVNHQDIRKVVNGEKCQISYIKGMVASPDRLAAMQGHHATDPNDTTGLPHTLFMSDESSSVPHEYKRMAQSWAKRQMIFGNPWPCNNFFYHAVKGDPKNPRDKGGDIPRPSGRGYYRKVIQIKAEDSPNVRLGLEQIKAGLEPTEERIIPGVKSYQEYVKNRATWDDIQQTVSLDGDFYEGATLLLFPPAWLKRAREIGDALYTKPRKAKAIGIDPAEGGDKTAMAAVDEYGLIEMVARKTPNTADIPREAKAFMIRHNVPPERVFFDRGGGGKQHADRLREEGYEVNTVAFGETLNLPPKRGITLIETKLENREERYAYVNRRAEMYGELSMLCDPSHNPAGFGISDEEVRRQLKFFPKSYDGEGRLKLPPKNKRTADSTEQCLIDLIGCSPDEADALVLAVYGLTYKPARVRAGLV